MLVGWTGVKECDRQEIDRRSGEWAGNKKVIIPSIYSPRIDRYDNPVSAPKNFKLTRFFDELGEQQSIVV